MAEATVGNARTSSTTTTKTPQKGKPLGIPKWGWIAGIALGLVIGYLVIKSSKNQAGGSSGIGAGSDSSPLGNSDSGSGGGASSGSATTPNPFVTSTGTDTQGSGSDPGSTGPSGDPSITSTGDTPQSHPLVLAPNPYLPEPSLPAYAQIPGTATHPQTAPVGTIGSVPIQNIPIGSNVHQPGVQL